MVEIENVKLPRQTEKELADLTLLWKRYRADWDYSRPHFERGKKGILSYKRFRDANLHPYKYNPSVPLVFTIVEQMTSMVVNALFSKPDLIEINPVEKTHYTKEDIPDEKIARQCTKVLNTLMLNPDRELQLNLKEIIKECCTLGTGYSVKLPEFDFKRESDMGGPVYLGPKLIQKSFFDLIPDKEGARISNCRWVWDIERVPIEELRNRIGKNGYKNFNDATLRTLTDNQNWIPDGINYFEDIQTATGNAPKSPGGYDPKSGIVLLLHFYDINTGHFKTIAANRLLVRDSSASRTITTASGESRTINPAPPYPYNPYGDLRLWSYTREFYATGVAEIAAVYQDEINLWKSMRYENIEMLIHKVLLYNPLLGVKEEDIWVTPAGTIKVHDVNLAIKELDMDDISQSSYIEQAQAEQNARDATSSQDTVTGNMPHRREAATTVLTIQKSAQRRTETFLKDTGFYLRLEAKKDILQMHTFMSKKEYERILGEPDAGFYKLSTNDIKNNYDIVTSVGSVDSVRGEELQNMINWMQVAQQQPEPSINWDATNRNMFKLLNPNENPDVFILSPEQKQEKILQQQQTMQAQQGQAQQGQAPVARVPQSRPSGQPTISPEAIIRESAAGRLGGNQGQQ
jgi:hypothetical protein